MSPAAPALIALRRSLPSCLEAVDAICHEIRSMLKGSSWQGAAFALELVARECLNNAVLHGNAGDPAKRLFVALRCTGKGICLQVADEGTGPPTAAGRSPVVPAGEATQGRGFAIVRLYAERVRFNRQGNQITVWLRFPAGHASEKL